LYIIVNNAVICKQAVYKLPVSVASGSPEPTMRTHFLMFDATFSVW